MATPHGTAHFHTALPFEAARHIPSLPAGYPGTRLHGHSFLATLRCALPADYAPYPGGELETLQAQWRTELDRLDYRLVNDHLATPTVGYWHNATCRASPRSPCAARPSAALNWVPMGPPRLGGATLFNLPTSCPWCRWATSAAICTATALK